MRKTIVFIMTIVCIMVALPVNAQQPQPTPNQSGNQQAPAVVAPELFNQGSAALQAGDYQKALLDYSLFLLLNPTDSQGFLARGFTNQYLGELDGAVADITQALNFAPPLSEYTARAYLTRADVYIQQDEIEAALGDLNTSLDIMPNSAEALATRAAIFIFQRRFEDALEDYNAVITLQPEAVSAYTQRGELNRQLGNLDAALADFNQVLELDPNSLDAYFNRALIYGTQAEYSAALDDLDTILTINPGEFGVYLLRAQINVSAANVEDAALDYLNWMDSIETRRFAPVEDTLINEPFAIEMGPGWVYNFVLEAEAGQILNIEAVRLENAEADPLLVLVDAERTPLVADDDGGGNLNALIQNYVIPAEGQYTVIISHAGSGNAGRLAVRIRLDDAN